MGLSLQTRPKDDDCVLAFYGHARAARMGFSCGGTVVIGSAPPSLHGRCAHWLVRCDLGLGQIELRLQLYGGCIRCKRGMRNVAMAAANGETGECVVCEVGLECGLSPNNEKGKVRIDSSCHFYVDSSISTICNVQASLTQMCIADGLATRISHFSPPGYPQRQSRIGTSSTLCVFRD